MKQVWMLVFLSMILMFFLPQNADSAPYPVVKELFKVTESIDDRNLAKKKLIEELEKELEKLGERFVIEKKRALDNIISKTGDVTNYSLQSRYVFAVYSYYALKGELPTNGITIYWQNLFSPLKQAKEGNSPQHIRCYGDLVKIIKNSDRTAICITLKTALILVERNFGTSEDVMLYHEIESVRNCEIGKIFHWTGLGSFSITVENNDLETCNITVEVEIEMGVTKTYCKIPIDELQKFRGWEKGSLGPNLEGLENYCGSLIDSLFGFLG